MVENLKQLQERVAVSDGRAKADLVITNGRIINVFSGEIMDGDIAIKNGYIAGIGDFPEAEKVIDAAGAFIAPGFIDAHVHVESAMVTPAEFARVLLPNGVTTIVTDPHEIANVAGEKGIEFMLEDAKGAPLDMFVMLPSSVPATDGEHNGETLHAEKLHPLYRHEKVIGLAEVMDFPSVAKGSSDILTKIIDAKKEGGRIDGHGAGLTSADLNNYLAVGIRTDHESTTAKEATDRLRAGMFVMLREGTVGRDLLQTIPAVSEKNSHRFCFCTDDKLINDLITEGSINYNIRLAINNGIEPITAIQMATINAANCHNLPYLGAIAAGYQADIVFLKDLETVEISKVLKNGEVVVENGVRNEAAFHKQAEVPFVSPPINHHLRLQDLALPLTKETCYVIGMQPNSLFTEKRIEQVTIQNGKFVPNVENDLLKMAVVERHHDTGCVGVGIVKGFGLTEGAIATTVAHDSHNIVAVGVSDEAMKAAIDHITQTGGGIAVVDGAGKVLHDLALPIAGLLSDKPYEEVETDLAGLLKAFNQISSAKGFDPFLTLSFLTLPVIPELKLTDQGLFDFATFQIIPNEVN
ncbi:adenine deaminase [Listeria cossartiae subsp. cayugensis]|uniref:adenine deaminase n=1 Tax=Listeria cossartiae TaxID=2838249 RepID=UPI0028806E95|nr:adenine deaminase [Listeria cossartiae]MDT0004534.1 adenine deaminase [Listeria cossartiae subsp. cayugensis]MDT0020907.1 adenine deaminase [Listeria cossartiae subsp. cayugensis]MDT0037313.1 adenine deaminase [Listeria cossartiae subsp. cayugensis]MDT0042679.1 adenine deaminase [Listeria cossartiae subsp. cayugensis]MDT0048014.1 adenine deaminase [Listeria cossartiae subsp. cayugensis]